MTRKPVVPEYTVGKRCCQRHNTTPSPLPEGAGRNRPHRRTFNPPNHKGGQWSFRMARMARRSKKSGPQAALASWAHGKTASHSCETMHVLPQGQDLEVIPDVRPAQAVGGHGGAIARQGPPSTPPRPNPLEPTEKLRRWYVRSKLAGILIHGCIVQLPLLRVQGKWR
jgi:hypothetical protein